MNLAYKYGDMYWKCGCLSVNSGAIGDNKSTDYGKVAKAVSEMNDIVNAPDINKSDDGFTINDKKILFGLKAISEVGYEDIQEIKKNRPFSSFEDFLKRGNNISKKGIVNLIKCGALDEFGDRIDMMNKYLSTIIECKNSFTMANIPMLIECNLIDTKKYDNELKVYYLYKMICTKANLLPKDKERKGEWYKINNDILDNFNNVLVNEFDSNELIYDFDISNYIVKKSKFKKILDKEMETIVKEVLQSKYAIEAYNKKVYDETYEKYADGNIYKWEMDSMNYYKTGHELDVVNKNKYMIKNFFELPENPTVTDSWTNKKGKEFKRYKLDLIMGTVLDRDKTKHTVSLLTTDGVVTCKMYDGAFNFYNKTISTILPNGKKKRIEESWFKRGTKLIVYGFRMGEQFKPRKYKNSVFQHTVMRINEVKEDGTLIVQQDRADV